MPDWIEKTPEFVAARYDRLAPVYGVYEWLYALPLVGVRRKSVEALALAPGGAVLELGCGSGRNLERIVAKVGPTGSVYGVDLSRGMLARAQSLVRRRGWTNVHLQLADAATYAPPQSIRAALFCFSYSTMRDRLAILARVWSLLEAGGRLVITDAQLRPGWPRRLFGRLGNWSSNRTLLGRPDTDPERDLGALADRVEVQRIPFVLGFDYVVCAATRPATPR
jgi:ubiquinone/menaquinone biosynthesis C-methylase UbiE